MFKRYLMVLTMLLALPAFANAWYVNAKTTPAAGQGTINPTGSKFYATGVSSGLYTVTPAPGYKVTRVTLDGSTLIADVDGKYTAPYVAGKSWRYIVAYFAVNTVDITVTAPVNGAIREDTYESLTKISVGSNRQLLVIPNTGYSVATVTADGAVVTDNVDGISKTATYSNLVVNQTITATFTQNPASYTANAGQNVATTGNAAAYTATLFGSANGAQGATYAWTCTTAPAGATLADLQFGTPATASTTVYSAIPGTYTATLTVNGTATDTADITVVSRAAYQAAICTGCHAGNTEVTEYNASAQAATTSCQACHSAAPHNSSIALAATGIHAVQSVYCSNCHTSAPHTNGIVDQPRRVDADAVLTGPCVSCHTTKTAEQIKKNVYDSEISERYVTSRHATQSARAGFCSACHSHEGFVARESMGKIDSSAALVTAYTAATVPDVYLLPVGSSTIAGVDRKQCSTCHSEHDFALRGAGDVIQTGLLPAGGSTSVVDTTRTVFSAEFNLCTSCHQVGLDATFVADAGYTDRGMFTYQLSADYTAANLIVDDPSTTIIQIDGSSIYYHAGSGIGRNFTDTHFAGTIATYLVDYNNADTNTGDTTLVGYNINVGNKNACTICHDPHTAGKMLSGVADVYTDDNTNKAISYATGLGGFHTDYLSDPFSRVNTGCTPCHTGSDFPRLTEGETLAGAAVVPAGVTNRWSVVGCRSCHNQAQPNATAGTNNAAAFDDVRQFPAGYEFKFNAAVVPASPDTYAATFTYPAAAVVTAAELGNSTTCFECHKGRTAGVMPATEAPAGTQNYAISYLHYAPSAAVLFGNDAKMALTYPGKTYAGRMVHYDGSTKFNCTDCHNVHTGKDVMYESASCNSCHNAGSPALSKTFLAARTEAYSVALLDAIYDAMNVAYNAGTPDVALNATLITKLTEIFTAADETAGKAILMTYIQERQTTFPNRKVAHAVATWKVFTYEDGPEHGLTHGHGGSWAHNSKFARQLMYDSIEDIGGVLTGLTRP